MPTDAFSDLLYLISLNQIMGPGRKMTLKLLEIFGSAKAVFQAREETLRSITGAAAASVPGTDMATAIKTYKNFRVAEQELVFLEKHQVRALTMEDPEYPRRLMHCEDRPVVLYYRGVTDLNHARMISVVGTRRCTEYGRQLTEQLCQGLAASDCVVVSGLAYGIDAIAHQSALELSIQTVAVLGHGLNTVYPPRNATLSRSIGEQGGLLTEYQSNMPAIKYHFPQRNRIVAGMSVATVVVESPEKGGSLITAELAGSYNRDVFAFPGRTTDLSMAGNHSLIRRHKAAIITSAQDLLEMLGWEPVAGGKTGKPLPLREPVSFFEQPVFNLLTQGEPVSMEDIQSRSGLTDGAIAEALLYLEIKGWIRILPGNRYILIRRNDSG